MTVKIEDHEDHITITWGNGSVGRLLRIFDSQNLEVEIIEAKGHHHKGDVVVWSKEYFDTAKRPARKE